jgi:hypothetical protein
MKPVLRIRDVIPDPDFSHPGSRIQGSQKHRISDTDPQHWMKPSVATWHQGPPPQEIPLYAPHVNLDTEPPCCRYGGYHGVRGGHRPQPPAGGDRLRHQERLHGLPQRLHEEGESKFKFMDV